MNDYSSAFQPDMSQFMQPQQAQGQKPSQASSYPALPNAYGLGQVQQPQQQQAAQDPYAQKQQAQQQMISDSSKGAGPWDFVGVSNVR